MMRGADHLAQGLAAAGVETVFGLSGNQIMPVFDAFLDAGIRIVHTRHEAAAVYMAEAQAQLSGGLGVALVTAGAGLGNAIAPLLTARASDTPVVLLSGDSPVAQDGCGAFQEMDQCALTGSVTKASMRVTAAGDMARHVAKALQLAQSGRPGPVHLSLPADVLRERVDAAPAPRASAAAGGQLDTAPVLAALRAAERPLVVLGPALTETRAPGLAQALTDRLQAPAFAMESPRGTDDPALGRVAGLLAQSDLVLALGKPVDFTLGMGGAAREARWLTVQGAADEIARARRNLGARLLHAVQADPARVARALAQGAALPRRAAWRGAALDHLTARVEAAHASDGLTSATLCRAVQREIDHARRPVLVCDGGEFGQWAQHCTSAPRRIINGVSGAIGGGLCYALGARAADPEATVFALMGDGTAGFHLAEFETALREDLPFVAVIGNDGRWNAEHQIQLRDYGADRLIGCQLGDARYDLAVAALGGHGAFVTEPGALAPALRRAVESGKPACVNVRVEGLPAPVMQGS